MKLQAAIDRMSFEEIKKLIGEFSSDADIIEVGTSFVKDYGLYRLRELNDMKGTAHLLCDMKTCDEGACEFEQGYRNGFDILTVMGSSSLETIKNCYETALKYKKEILIDLLECRDEKIEEISGFQKAIYCLHHSVDKEKAQNPEEAIRNFKMRFPNIRRLAIAGGVTLDSIAGLKREGTEIVIVGSAITKAENPAETLKRFKEEMTCA